MLARIESEAALEFRRRQGAAAGALEAVERDQGTFAAGDGGTILTDPQVNYDAENARNVVWEVGGTPKGKKVPVQYAAYADRNHPMSDQSLGRNGKARHLVEKIEDNDLLKVADCKERAEYELSRSLQLYIDVSFDAVPAPFLEEKDAVAVKTADYAAVLRSGGIDALAGALDNKVVALADEEKQPEGKETR